MNTHNEYRAVITCVFYIRTEFSARPPVWNACRATIQMDLLRGPFSCRLFVHFSWNSQSVSRHDVIVKCKPTQLVRYFIIFNPHRLRSLLPPCPALTFPLENDWTSLFCYEWQDPGGCSHPPPFPPGERPPHAEHNRLRRMEKCHILHTSVL